MSTRLEWLEARYRAGAYLTIAEHTELARLRGKAYSTPDEDEDTLTPGVIASLASDAVDIAGDLFGGGSNTTDTTPSIDTPDLGGGGGFGGGGGGDSF